mgnify:CR=1 FL=1
MRRASWLTDMADAVEGFVTAERVVLDWKGPGAARRSAPLASWVLGYARPESSPPRKSLSSSRRPRVRSRSRLPAPSNFLLASFRPGLTDRFYANRRELLDHLAEITRDEILWLDGAGRHLRSVRRAALTHIIWILSSVNVCGATGSIRIWRCGTPSPATTPH